MQVQYTLCISMPQENTGNIAADLFAHTDPDKGLSHVSYPDLR